MLVETHSYFVTERGRSDHAKLMTRLDRVLRLHGAMGQELLEEVGAHYLSGVATGRVIRTVRFEGEAELESVQHAQQMDEEFVALLDELSTLVNLPMQEQNGLVTIAYYRAEK